MKFGQVALDCTWMAPQIMKTIWSSKIWEFPNLLREFDLIFFDFGYLESDYQMDLILNYDLNKGD
jgi:hypothetical protein